MPLMHWTDYLNEMKNNEERNCDVTFYDEDDVLESECHSDKDFKRQKRWWSWWRCSYNIGGEGCWVSGWWRQDYIIQQNHLDRKNWKEYARKERKKERKMQKKKYNGIPGLISPVFNDMFSMTSWGSKIESLNRWILCIESVVIWHISAGITRNSQQEDYNDILTVINGPKRLP